MGKEEIIKILEDYEYFVDDDFGGYYEHINCKQRAFTPLGILEILDYIDNLQTQLKKQQEIIDKSIYFIKNGDLLYLANKNSVVYKNNIEIKAVADRLNDLLQILEDKEV